MQKLTKEAIEMIEKEWESFKQSYPKKDTVYFPLHKDLFEYRIANGDDVKPEIEMLREDRDSYRERYRNLLELCDEYRIELGKHKNATN
jgi:hypothetical protein